MKYEITNSAIRTTKQCDIHLHLKIEVYDNNDKFITEIVGGIISGNANINAESDVRRTYTLTIIPDLKSRTIIMEEGLIWLDKYTKLYIGIENKRTSEIEWWKQGSYIFASVSCTYDAVTNQLDLSCSDFMAMLDGTKNGQIGALTSQFPAYQELFNSLWIDYAVATGVERNVDAVFEYCLEYDDYTTPITKSTDASVREAAWKLCDTKTKLTQAQIKKYSNVIRNMMVFSEVENREVPIYQDSFEYCRNTDDGVFHIVNHHPIRDIVIQYLKQWSVVKDFNIEHIGEPKGQPEANKDWKEHRKKYPMWEDMPYDLEFSAGTTNLAMLTEVRDLYPNYEMYFDKDGTFCFNMKPSLYEDDITLTNDYIQDILISENTTLDMTTVRNVIEVWGKVYEADFFQNNIKKSSYSGNVYSVTIDEYIDPNSEKEPGYYNGDKIAFRIPAKNKAGAKLNVDGLGAIDILDEAKEIPVLGSVMNKDEIHVFKIKKSHVDGVDTTVAYWMGQWQAHAISALVADEKGDYSKPYTYYDMNGNKKVCNSYTKEYFRQRYACDDVHLEIIPNSPYTVQKLGEVLQVCSGDKYDNIDSVSYALDQARYELWQNARLTDSISITTKICPFADVNIKVTYKPKIYDSYSVHEYMVTSVSHDMAGGTTTWQLVRFYPLFIPDGISENTWGDLQTFIYNDILEKKWGEN